MYGIHVMIHYGIAFETKATIWALLAWRTVTEVSGDWCPTESIEQTPMKIKNRHVAYSSMAHARINPDYLSMVLTYNTLSIHLISFSLQTLSHTHTHTHEHTYARTTHSLKSRMCNIATPDSIRQCPWHWQRSNSEFLQLKKESRNMSMIASWIAWLST